jgi:transposase InsO family protein
MADLPVFRLKSGCPAFTHTGVDYFGPIEVTIFRRVVKRWGVIFTCLNCRCVHLEMAYSLDTSSFICCLDRFMNRRGVPATLHSDNGTNFVGAQRQLAECLDKLNQSAIISHLNRKMTKWYFNPPAAPHFGGVWERMVRAAKEALVAVLGKQRLTDELLITTLTHIENVLNSRKLTPPSENPADPEALTPNHLLLGRANPKSPPDVFDKDDLTARERWRVVQAISDQFWTLDA